MWLEACDIMENKVETTDKDDEVIVVTMPRGDYNIMRDLIRDRKSTSFVMNKVKVFSLTLSGVIVAWWVLGEKFLVVLKKALS